MDRDHRAKISGIRQIVRLKEFLQKWQNVTLVTRGNISPYSNDSGGRARGILPAVSQRIMRCASSRWDSDEESCMTPDSPRGVPRGYLAVYVGSELRRFIVPTRYLNHHLFKVLLEKVEEEFGFDHSGALILPCEIETFKYLLQCMECREKDHLFDGNGSKDPAAMEMEEEAMVD